MDAIYDLLFHLCGYICGQRPERSLFLFGQQSPLCWRCLGLYIFLFLGLIFCASLRVKSNRQRFRICLFGCIITSALLAFDVFIIQSLMPNNTSRFITGMLLGGFLSAFIWQCLVALFSPLEYYTNNIHKRRKA